MPKHTARLILLLIAFAATAIAAKSYFTADSFYRTGHYRMNSVPEIAAMTPAFQTPRACQSCHAPRLDEWSGGHHKTVICEVCHGALPGHPQSLRAAIPTDTVRLCTQCHEKMPGRPATIRQVDPDQHGAGATQCIVCHNPHAPKIGAPVALPAAPHAVAAELTATCAACHGARGQATADNWPNLAGQNAAYIARSLGSFKTGARNEPTMAPMAQTVADEDVPRLARYFSSLPCRGPVSPPHGADTANGKRLAVVCASCHGANGRPVNDSWPALAGQNPTYLKAALSAFRDGTRNDPFMSPMAKGLSDSDIADLANHFAALPCGATNPGWAAK